jgi:hypothetical protein
VNRLRRLMALGLLAGAAVRSPAADGATPGAAVPVMFQSAPGRFEVAAVDSGGGQRVTALAGDAWRELAGPLGLPESFSSPVFVRLVPAADWGRDLTPFRVIAEVGGVVSVRIRWDETTPEPYVRRALVQALLIRLAVARHGITEKLTAPLWLEQACVGWWCTRAEPAQFDALKQAAARQLPPRLEELLAWQRGMDEPESLVDGAVWLLTFLQSDATRAGEWPALVARLLGGEAAAGALAACYAGRFADERERELWWQTGWHQLRAVRTVPGLDAAESRAEIAEQARFVFVQEDREKVVGLRDVLAHDEEPKVAAELKRRKEALNRAIPLLHPFYRNAGLSLADVLAARQVKPAKREALCAAFERDWSEARELDAASAAALTALERKR